MIPAAERAKVGVRAFAARTGKRPRRRWFRKTKPIVASDIEVTFDTETHVDAAQQLRVGGYTIHKADILKEAGLFYDRASLNRGELRTLRRYAKRHGRELLTDREFVDRVIYGVALAMNATLVGFNLPFDLSRLAIGHGSARGTMRRGFTFALTSDPRWPNVQIKHLSNRSALIRFAAQRRQRTSRSARKRQRPIPIRRGFFADVRTLAGTLVGGSHSLASLSKLLDTSEKKEETGEHGEELTEDYLDYLMRDVRVTRQCFVRLRNLYRSYGLTEAPLTKLFSEASLGKALLKQMGIQGWRKVQPAFPRRSIGRILATYYGGRSEVRDRRRIRRVLYLDFLSMYPTVCALMGLWRFMIARGIRSEDATSEVRRLLARIELEDVREKDLWNILTTIVQVRPRAGLFPVRSPYDGAQYTIGLNHLTSARPMWFTLADCIVSTLLTGRAPEVLMALRYEPIGVQPGLAPIDLLGKPEYRIDPYNDDPFKRIIELRSTVKGSRHEARARGEEALADRLDAEQQALKMLANTTSYGIFVELNVRNFEDLQDLTCYGMEDPFQVAVRNVEEPGRYFHPLLATLITGGARLLLACAESLTEAEGLGWMFCDTDSWALVKPEGMSEVEFLARSERIRSWFQRLSPYDVADPVLKLEDANFRLRNGKLTDELEPLYGFAVSDKRYVLFNLYDRRPVIRKASAHGLGHLRAPYGPKEAPADIPVPTMNLRDIGVDRWQYDLWYRIVEAALEGHPDQVGIDLPGLNLPAVSQYAATTPELLRWFKGYNEGLDYRNQVRPFGFLLAFQTRRKHIVGDVRGGDPSKSRIPSQYPASDLPRAVAPFSKDPDAAAASCFDRMTREPVPPALLPTYRESLAQYHLNPEDKFLNGDYTDSGVTSRRHVDVSGLDHIGKESERWEEQYFIGMVPAAQIRYGDSPETFETSVNELIRAAQQYGRRRLASASGVSLGEVSMIMRGSRKPKPATVARLIRGIEVLDSKSATQAAGDQGYRPSQCPRQQGRGRNS